MQGCYADRRHAGRVLAASLRHYAGRPDVVVLALPRGGVPVGFESSRQLGAPLDIYVVRKIGSPFDPEVALGAVGTGGVQVLNRELIDALRLRNEVVSATAARERAALLEDERRWRGDRPAERVSGKTVLLVDDGLATGATMRAAIAGLQLRGPARIVGAVPVAAAAACEELHDELDELVCAFTPDRFQAVSDYYDDFDPVSDDDVRDLLAAGQHPVIPVEGP